MLLREIHIKGFKSFADSVRMRFEEGVTSVVGPNGCGKSNFLDAVRWVLGEQRARLLRVEHMQQLIFNGSRVRKAMHRAEVSIILERTKNLLPTHRHETQITRIIYKTGESEYLINGTPARLRDLTHLVLDSGISPEAYSIIELKMVEDLLSDREGSRARLFEQAAGIAKFKKQKAEALKKLAATEDALMRIQDILHELQKNLDTLEQQSQKAKIYQQKYQTYEVLRAYYTSLREKVLVEKDQAARQAQTQAEKKLSTLRGDVHTREAQMVKDTSQVDILEKSLQKAQKILHQHTQALQEAVQRIDLKKQKHLLLEHRITEQKEKIQKQKKETYETKLRAEQSAKNLKTLAPEVSRLKRMYEQAASHHTTTLEEIQRTRSEYQTLLQKQLTTEKEHHTKHKDLLMQQVKAESVEEEIRSLAEVQATHTQASEDQKGELERLYSLQKQDQMKAQKVEQRMEQVVQAQKRKAQILQSQQQELANYEHTLRHHQDTLSMLVQMQASMEGFPEAIRAIRSHHSFKDKLPLVSEILEILPSYEALTTSYLRNYSQYFVSLDRQTAEAAVSYLYEHQKGEASFFILDEFTSPASSRGELMKRFVRTTSRYEKLVYFLFQHVSVAEDSVADHLSPTAVLLDDKTHSIRSQGILKGGRGAEKQPLWGLEAEKSSAEHRIQEATKRIHELRTTLQRSAKADSELPSLEHQKQTLHKQLQMHTQAIALAEQRLGQYHTHIKDAKLRTQTLHTDQKNLEHTILSEQTTLQKTKQSLSQIEQEKKHIETQLQQQESQYETAQQESQRAQLAYMEKENEKKHCESSIALHHSYESQTQERLREEEEMLTTLQREVQQLQHEITQAKKGLSTYYTKEEQAKKEVDKLEQDYYQFKGKVHEQTQSLREYEKGISQAQLLIKEYEGVLTQVQSEQAHLQEAFSETFNSSWKESLEKKKHLLPKNISTEAEEIQRKSERLKEELARMGHINLLAAENYEKLQERHTFISKEEQDLLSAKQSIEETMQMIHQTVQSRFMKAFSSINEHFQKVFKHLFAEEDICELRLLSKPSEELPDIEIIAQPKGKKPMRIEQLSSGEKTLTAIALLMAIYLHKPSPFCILDEVDAPLDDVNSQKFNQLVRTLSQKAQFILITHNKSTMKSSDILYGFTMPEAGVTKILPVDLRKVQSYITPSDTTHTKDVS